MSTSDVLPPKEITGLLDKTADKAKTEDDETTNLSAEENITGNLNGVKDNQTHSKRYAYTKDELLELRKAPVSLEKPGILLEEFFNKEGVWDPEAWFRSDISRSSSPAVFDGRPITDEKKSDLIEDDGITLTPHRESFKLGCQVKSSINYDRTIDKKMRLTGRAINQRKQHHETNYKDSESISEKTHEFEKMRRERNNYDRDDHFGQKDQNFRHKPRGNSYNSFSRNRNDSDGNRYYNHKKDYHEEEMPEWMTDGPTSQLDTIELPTYKDIEEEKKAFAKKNKKKVRISPDVETQEIMDKKPTKRKTQSPKPSGRNSTEKKDKKDGKFDMKDFFDSVDYYPPELFHQDIAYGDGVKSRFTQYFQSQEQQQLHELRTGSSSRKSSSSGEPLVPNEVFTGQLSPSSEQQPFFTPIQPAPTLLSAAATAHVIQSNNIAGIIEKQKHQQLQDNLKKASKEVRGSLNVEELEKKCSQKHPIEAQEEKSPLPADSNAFNMFLQTMKNAGQLPEKPSPVVSGLPAHLLPQPPARTSPVFEKLKRSLSRSPSPKEFVKAVTAVAGIITSNPTIDNELALLKSRSSPIPPSTIEQHVLKPEPLRSPKTPTPSEIVNVNRSRPTSQPKKTPMNAFTPTSVLKKMHNDRKEELETSITQIFGKHSEIQDDEKRPVALGDERKRLFQDLEGIEKQSQQKPENLLPFRSAPPTPRNQSTAVGETQHPVSASAPGTPNQRNAFDPPSISRYATSKLNAPSDSLEKSFESAFQRVNGEGKHHQTILMAPSAFQSVDQKPKNVGVIGSKPMYQKPQDISTSFNQISLNEGKQQQQANPKLAPGNGAVIRTMPERNSPPVPNQLFTNPLQQQTTNSKQQKITNITQPLSQQQQLLQAQRRAQIQQAELIKQNKLREIAKQANQQYSKSHQDPVVNGARPLLPDPDHSTQPQQLQQQQRQNRPSYQQSQHQQLLAFQQQQKQQMLAQHRLLAANQIRQKQQPPFPIPMQGQQMGVGLQPFQQQHPLNTGLANVNLAAQAIAQQHLIQQARARLVQEQLLQQQPQVLQAALMAQAALVRGQAQAQAAMMLNPRNLPVMAQLGLRPPFANQKKYQGPPPPTPMQPNNQNSTSTGANQLPLDDVSVDENLLSKWFSNDVLQQLPPNKPKPNSMDSGKVMSVEELERMNTK